MRVSIPKKMYVLVIMCVYVWERVCVYTACTRMHVRVCDIIHVHIYMYSRSHTCTHKCSCLKENMHAYDYLAQL